MTTEPTDATLRQRCAEVVEWQRTGMLPGDALRDYAKQHWAGHTDALQMAERDTSAQAMEAIARGGQPSGAGEPVGWLHSHPDEPKGDLCSYRLTPGDLRAGWTEVLVYTTPQPTQAVPPAGLEPLTDAQAQELIELESWGPDAIGLNAQLLRTIRRTEAAHGIKGKEAGNAD